MILLLVHRENIPRKTLNSPCGNLAGLTRLLNYIVEDPEVVKVFAVSLLQRFVRGVIHPRHILEQFGG